MIDDFVVKHYSVFPTKITTINWLNVSELNNNLNKLAFDTEEYTLSNPLNGKPKFTNIYNNKKSLDLLKLSKMIEAGINNYMNINYGVDSSKYSILINGNVRINKSINPDLPHRHIGSDIVCTYYSKVNFIKEDINNNFGNFIFFNPNSLVMHRPLHKDYEIFEIVPEEGLMVISPCYAFHVSNRMNNIESSKITWIHNIKIKPKNIDLCVDHISINDIKNLNK